MPKKSFVGILIIFAFVFSSCDEDKKPQSTSSTTNKEYKVDFLFEHDGCKIYRFIDYENARYFTNCKGSTSWVRQESGKTVIYRHEGVEGSK